MGQAIFTSFTNFWNKDSEEIECLYQKLNQKEDKERKNQYLPHQNNVLPSSGILFSETVGIKNKIGNSNNILPIAGINY